MGLVPPQISLHERVGAKLGVKLGHSQSLKRPRGKFRKLIGRNPAEIHCGASLRRHFRIDKRSFEVAA